jgi:protein ImuB
MSRRPPAGARRAAARAVSEAGLELRAPAAGGEAARVHAFSTAAALPASRALWLCLHLPRLALEIHTRLVTPTPALAIVDAEDRLCRVIACDARAAALGVHSEQALNTALALAPSLVTIARDMRRERAALLRLAAWAGQFTPRVSVAPPDALLLEVRGSLALFAGAETLIQLARSEVGTLGYSAQLGLAPTPLAAAWLARAGMEDPVTEGHALPGRLAAVPLACLRWPAIVHKALHGMGVRTVGDCLRLPRDGFARRFGPERLADLDRALGKRPDPRSDFQAPARFSAQLDLPCAMQALEALQHALALLLDELDGFLRARDGGIQSLHLSFVHHAATATQVTLELAQPQRQRAHLLALLTTRLERIVLPEPVLALRLRSGPVLTCTPQTPELLGGHDQPAATALQLIERLRARLGTAAVHGIGPRADHRPEAAWRIAEPGAGTRLHLDRERPLWLLPAPRLLDLADGHPCLEGRLELLRGPERIETGWWDSDVTRDYYVARNPQGMRLWIYRERRGERAWFLQGIFA